MKKYFLALVCSLFLFCGDDVTRPINSDTAKQNDSDSVACGNDTSRPGNSVPTAICKAGSPNCSNSLARPENYVLAWSDEFDSGNVPNSTKWAYDIGSPLLGDTVWGNNEQEHYTSSSANSCVANGKLTIQAKYETPAGAAAGVIASSARLRSNTSDYYDAIGSTPYGFYEIRAKLSCIPGSWPAIWLLGKSGNWPQQGEIDILEWAGKQNIKTKATSAIHNGAHSGGGIFNLPNPQYGEQTVTDLCTDYHKFQLHWLSDRIILGVDGDITLTYQKPSIPTNDTWPFDQPAFLIMNVAVGGTLGGNVNPSDIADMKMEVDYVKVWQKP